MTRNLSLIALTLPLAVLTVGCTGENSGDCVGSDCEDSVDDTEFEGIAYVVAPYDMLVDVYVDNTLHLAEQAFETDADGEPILCQGVAVCYIGFEDIGNDEWRIIIKDPDEMWGFVDKKIQFVGYGEQIDVLWDDDQSGPKIRDTYVNSDSEERTVFTDGSDEEHWRITLGFGFESVVTGNTFFGEEDDSTIEGTISDDNTEIWYYWTRPGGTDMTDTLTLP